MPLQATSGAASYDAFGGGVAAVPQYIEDVFSTYLYTGNGSAQVIENGINLGSSNSGGSVYFDKAGDYVEGPTNSAFAFGTGDFTISAWVYVLNGTSAQIIWTNQTTSSANAPNLGFFILNNKVCINNTNTAHSESTGTIANNTWAYIGVTRESGTYTFYINGSASGTTSSIGTDNITENACRIGYGAYGSNYYFGGYISDLRIIKGSAVTPSVPSAPVTAVSGTSLLTLQSPTFFTDASSNNFTLTRNGDVVGKTFGPYTSAVAGKGGMVWIKTRNIGANHQLFDTNRGVYKRLATNTSNAEFDYSPNGLTAFNSNGFTLSGSGEYNLNGYTQVSWTFRKQPKFFDVVTWTGNGSSPRNITHNLGSVPACIITKCTSTSGDWFTYHASLGNRASLSLEQTNGQEINTSIWGSTTPTSTVFTVGNANINTNGATYVAYLFAHNAGGFGLTGTDNVISCGSYTGDSTSLQSINLGYEPQLVLIKSASIAGTEWAMLDNMRGVATGGVDAILNPNTSGAEASPYDRVDFTSTGFNLKTSSSIYNETGTYIYIAIRRGPMKVPTSGTSVFQPVTYTGTGASLTTTTGINQDVLLIKSRTQTYSALFTDRLRGVGGYWINTASSAGENGANTTAVTALSNTSFTQGGGTLCGASGIGFIGYGFTRAPSFFDEVCYTGTGAAQNITHNLGVVPELMIVKRRSAGTGTANWAVYNATNGATDFQYLNTTDATSGPAAGFWNSTTPTSSVFTVGSTTSTNQSGSTYVAYLFATCAGVSKVGSYTGTATTLQIDCGFTGGARFVLIKRTDSTGDWYVWDSARGIVSGNDPYLLLNSTAAEVTITDYIDPYSAGFELSTTAAATVNVLNGTYIYLAIA